jgi:hypothetical protein
VAVTEAARGEAIVVAARARTESKAIMLIGVLSKIDHG